uniref:Uncharacterized protein n=1 Tax=Anguilla anguilla TaxID=7936 RepID=A0A0E9SRK3_ANGAN
MPAASSAFRCLDSVYHSSLHFISNSLFCTHHCVLYDLVSWSSLSLRRLQHWYIFIYKAILGKLPLYLCNLLSLTTSCYNFCSTRWLL